MNKTAQEQDKPKRVPPRRHAPHMAAYPDYTKSLAHQRYKSPVMAGIERGAQTGVTGAVLGALIARIVTDRLPAVAAGAGIGGLAAAVPGFRAGKQQAESEHSRMLFLRRRLGVNEPGELDALLQHPDAMSSLIQKQGQAQVARATVGALAGAIPGALWGYKVSPVLSGYEDVEPARRLSGVAGTATGALLGALLAKSPGTLGKFMSNPRTAMLIPTGLVSGELVPSGIAMMARQSKSTQDLADATRKSSIPLALKQLLNSNTGRGAAVGAGGAGILAILSGLSRARTEDEIRRDKSRTGMVGSDFLKYLLPALIGGGVVGSLAKAPGKA